MSATKPAEQSADAQVTGHCRGSRRRERGIGVGAIAVIHGEREAERASVGELTDRVLGERDRARGGCGSAGDDRAAAGRRVGPEHGWRRAQGEERGEQGGTHAGADRLLPLVQVKYLSLCGLDDAVPAGGAPPGSDRPVCSFPAPIRLSFPLMPIRKPGTARRALRARSYGDGDGTADGGGVGCGLSVGDGPGVGGGVGSAVALGDGSTVGVGDGSAVALGDGPTDGSGEGSGLTVSSGESVGAGVIAGTGVAEMTGLGRGVAIVGSAVWAA